MRGHIRQKHNHLQILQQLIQPSPHPFPNLGRGSLVGQYAVKVSGNWRVFFEFVNGDAYVVDYDDYN